MLNPNFAPAEPPTNSLIAGHHCGIQIHCTPQAKGAYDELAALSRKGNHWARLVISGIAALSSGRASMDNVFTKKGSGIAYGRGAFYVSLPGVLATFEANSDSTFILLRLKVDDSYFKNQRNHQNPGLWRVIKRDNEWNTKFVNNGRLLAKHKNRYVAIADSGFKTPDDAVRYVSASLEGIHDTVRKLINEEGFDLHFTPGGKRIGGYTNSKEAIMAESASSLHDSSQLLANTMYQSRDNNNITWFSDWGGSGVLTQAMQNLSDQNIKLEKHSILLNHPTTQPSKALALGRSLNLDPISGGQEKGYSPSELVGRLGILDGPISAYQRLIGDDNYSGKDLAIDTGEKAFNLGNVAVGAVGLLGVVGAVTTGFAGATGFAIAGAAYFVTGIVRKAFDGRRKHN